jgi:hypothetical protein
VLVLDDFLLAPMSDVERRDLLEVLEDRYDTSSTVITSQLPTKSWHQAIGDATIANAIGDRLRLSWAPVVDRGCVPHAFFPLPRLRCSPHCLYWHAPQPTR